MTSTLRPLVLVSGAFSQLPDGKNLVGAVNTVDTGTGLTGGPITTTGVIAIA